MRPSRSKTLLLVLSSLLSVLGAALIAEIYLRVTNPAIGRLPKVESHLGWSSPEYQAFTPTKRDPSSRSRILFLGDSYLAGSGIKSLDRRFCSLVDEQSPELEVAVFATGGWSIDQQLWAFRQKGRKWKPDIVVVAFCANNDISSIMTHHYGGHGMLKPYYTVNQEGELEFFNAVGKSVAEERRLASEPNAQPSAAWKRSYLLRILVLLLRQKIFTGDDYSPCDYPDVPAHYKLFPARQESFEEIYDGKQSLSWSPQMGVNHVSAYIKGDGRYNQEQWQLFESILVQLNHEVQECEASLAVMLLPVIFNSRNPDTIAGGSFQREFRTPDGPFTFSSSEPKDRLGAISARHGILFFDPTSEFRDIVILNGWQEAVWPTPGDRHFSATGHRILASITERWIQSNLCNLMKCTEQDKFSVRGKPRL